MRALKSEFARRCLRIPEVARQIQAALPHAKYGEENGIPIVIPANNEGIPPQTVHLYAVPKADSID